MSLKLKLIKWRHEISKEAQKLAKLVNFNIDEYENRRNEIFFTESVLKYRQEFIDELVRIENNGAVFLYPSKWYKNLTKGDKKV